MLGLVCPNGIFIGAPSFEMKTHEGDTLILYGPAHRLEDLDCRPPGPEGERARASAVAEQRERAADEARTREQVEAERRRRLA